MIFFLFFPILQSRKRNESLPIREDFFHWATLERGKDGEIIVSISLADTRGADIVLTLQAKEDDRVELRIPEGDGWTHYPFEKSERQPGARINIYRLR